MKNIFQQTKDYVKPPKRNVYDLSFVNHSTFNFGTLYPVLCKPVIPGDSFSIDTTFALRFMPTAFPVQTKITANLHFFYLRNRNLWDRWQKFIGHTGDSGEFPYIDVDSTEISTSSLADYLGVPTTLVGQSILFTLQPSEFFHSTTSGISTYYASPESAESSLNVSLDSFSTITPNTYSLDAVFDSVTFGSLFNQFVVRGRFFGPENRFADTLSLYFFKEVDGVYKSVLFTNQFHVDGLLDTTSIQDGIYSFDVKGSTVYFDGNENVSLTDLSFDSFSELFSRIVGDSYKLVIRNSRSRTASVNNLFPILQSSSDENNPDQSFISQILFLNSANAVSDLSDLSSTQNPFGDTSGKIRLNALPFRAYESVYNAFYRNEQNDPFIVDGQPEYDKYISNNGSGKDSTPYQLHRRNWELDFLTSSVQSPQQGIAPLVGVSMQGDFTFANKDSNGNVGYFSAKANYDSSGNITGFQLSDKVTVNGTVYTDTSDVPEDVKRGTVYNLNQLALGGISINDFRNVNALQRWLETNIRRGYKYRDIIKSHFGVDVDYNILDMPEFIGGISEPVFSTQVNQTTETESDPLGSYAGQLSLITQSRHTIKHYCDEHGYIIGIMSIVPTPCYSQLLPKDFIKSNYLDYFFPEFGHIGMQPIDYREVAPIQVYNVASSKLLNTFGYQRPWYDYIASVDEVHSLFRTNLRNFVLNRQFDTFPALNKEFLQVDADQLNDIFTVQDTSDKILGQIQFKITAKRPIPMFGIPRLE